MTSPSLSETAHRATARPVVFVLPGLGGENDPGLEEFWGPTRAVLDLVPISYLDWTDFIAADCNFEVLADHVLRQILSRSPGGPIRIAGYSLGGHLGYLAAVALQSQGRQVESLAILDAPADVSGFIPPFRQRVQARWARLREFNFRGGLASPVAKILIRERSRTMLQHLARYRQTRLPFRFDTFLHHTITMQLVLRLYPQWWKDARERSASLAAPTCLFRSESHRPSEGEDLGWGAYCSNLKVVQAEGSHRGMLHSSVNLPLRAAFVEALTASCK